MTVKAPEGKKPSRFDSAKPMMAGIAVGVVIVAAMILSVVQSRFRSGYVVIGDGLRVNVSVAATDATRERGLSGRFGLASDEGMYFLFQKPDQYAFWMKEMRFPIDIIWINAGAIVDITTDVPIPGSDGVLPTFAPRIPANRALEVRAGFAKAHGLRIGLPISEHLGQSF